jgi:hypothetical protein
VAIVPDTHDFADGAATSSEMNTYVRDPIRFLLNPPIFRGRSNTTQSLTTSVWTSLSLQLEDVDLPSPGGHDLVTNNSRYTAVYAGWYWVSAVACCTFVTATRVGIRYAVNGTAIVSSRSFQNEGSFSNSAFPCAGTLVFLGVGDYVEAQGFQETGSPQTFGSATADNNSVLSVKFAYKT